MAEVYDGVLLLWWQEIAFFLPPTPTGKSNQNDLKGLRQGSAPGKFNIPPGSHACLLSAITLEPRIISGGGTRRIGAH